MTRKSIYNWTIIILLVYTSSVIIGIFLRLYFPDVNGKPSIASQIFKDLLPFFLAVPAAWLGFCFQRRSSYLAALRELWSLLIPAAQQAIQYTYLQDPTDKDFAETQQKLSTVIDSLRGVFKNIGPNNQTGLYPYENLKEIAQIIAWLRFSSKNTEDEKYWARRCIKTTWSSMHQMLLLEFDREIPIYPLSKYLEARPSLADYLKKTKRKDDGTLDNEKLESCVRSEEETQKSRLTNHSTSFYRVKTLVTNLKKVSILAVFWKKGHIFKLLILMSKFYVR